MKLTKNVHPTQACFLFPNSFCDVRLWKGGHFESTYVEVSEPIGTRKPTDVPSPRSAAHPGWTGVSPGRRPTARFQVAASGAEALATAGSQDTKTSAAAPSGPGNARPHPAAGPTRRGLRTLTPGRGRWKWSRRAVAPGPHPQFAQGPRAPPPLLGSSPSDGEHRHRLSLSGSAAAPCNIII